MTFRPWTATRTAPATGHGSSQLADAGYAAVHWPVEHGGRGANELERLVFQEEYERAGGPTRVNIQGLMLAGPTVMAFGTPEQQQRWLPAMLRSDEVWCQGFSEPDAGSDLASLRTRAVVGRRQSGRQRPEDLDHGSALLRLDLHLGPHEQRRVQASRHHLGDDRPAISWSGRPPDHAAQRSPRVRRDLLRRRARADWGTSSVASATAGGSP